MSRAENPPGPWFDQGPRDRLARFAQRRQPRRSKACPQRLRARQACSVVYVCCRTEAVASRPYDHNTGILGCHGVLAVMNGVGRPSRAGHPLNSRQPVGWVSGADCVLANDAFAERRVTQRPRPHCQYRVTPPQSCSNKHNASQAAKPAYGAALLQASQQVAPKASAATLET